MPPAQRLQPPPQLPSSESIWRLEPVPRRRRRPGRVGECVFHARKTETGTQRVRCPTTAAVEQPFLIKSAPPPPPTPPPPPLPPPPPPPQVYFQLPARQANRCAQCGRVPHLGEGMSVRGLVQPFNGQSVWEGGGIIMLGLVRAGLRTGRNIARSR